MSGEATVLWFQGTVSGGRCTLKKRGRAVVGNVAASEEAQGWTSRIKQFLTECILCAWPCFRHLGEPNKAQNKNS